METELKAHLLLCGAQYADARNIQLTTVGRLAAKDGQFFERLNDGCSFTARKYDAVMSWFAENWPAELSWPADVPCPVSQFERASA